jgi:hypothetical protein
MKTTSSSSKETVIHLSPHFFGERERLLVQHGSLRASTFLYGSGVCGLRLQNEQGQLILLPFQGQQIWSMELGGRNLTMKSMFDEPRATRSYLETYGGFLLHCGASAMGVPTKDDSHPLHGDLPNAPYEEAWLFLGEDARGKYVGSSGAYTHTVAFALNYTARPRVTLHEKSTRVPISMAVENKKKTPMDLMYMAHVNFRPVDGGRLVYSAHCTPAHVRVRSSIPSHIKPPPGYEAFLKELEAHPEKHNVLAPGLAFDPEVVLYIDYLADANGWAHSLQVHGDGSADFISHRPDQLSRGVRWISRTPDQDALGLCLPSTSEPEGYKAEKAKGNVRTLPGKTTVTFEMEAGYLSARDAQEMAARIQEIVGK